MSLKENIRTVMSKLRVLAFVSSEQSKRIETVFDKLQDQENNLKRNELMNVIGRYPPENVIKSRSALFKYYTTREGRLTKETLKAIIQDEGGSQKRVESLTDQRTQNEFDNFFRNDPDATFMSAWLLRQNFSIVKQALKMPSIDFIFSISTGIPEDILSSLKSTFENFIDRGGVAITEASFFDRLSDIFPPCFVTGLFKLLDLNADDVIDMREFSRGVFILHESSEVDFEKVVFRMFRNGDSESEEFNVHNFEICLNQFVPKRVLQKVPCKMEELTIHVVFGFPTPDREGSLSEIIMLWLHFTISTGVELGSQWYLFSLNHLPPLARNENISVLKLSDQEQKYGICHPISMYEALFTPTPLPLQPVKSTKHLFRKSDSQQDNVQVTRGHQGHRSRFTSKKREEARTERTMDTSVDRNWFRKRFSSQRSSSSVHHSGSTSASISRPSFRAPDIKESDWKTQPLIAVDRRLAARIQQWSQKNGLLVNSEDQMLPSYLINPVTTRGAVQETLEVQALEVCVYAATHVKLRCTPYEKLITNVDPPKNKSFPELSPSRAKSHQYFSNDESSSSDVGNPRNENSTSGNVADGLRKRSKLSSNRVNDSAVKTKPEFLEISKQKLSATSVHFAFSRCHTVWEMFESICKYFVDYLGRDLNSDNCRIWLVDSVNPTESSTSLKSRPPTKTVNSNVNERSNKSSNENISSCTSKKIKLMPIDLRMVGDQQLARFLADQEPSSPYSSELLNCATRCSHTFNIAIECRFEFFFWTFNQFPTRAPQFTGLTNLGNTCYFNSVIQCLRATPDLTKEIRQSTTRDTKLAMEYINVLDQMQASGEPFAPQSLRQSFVQKWKHFNSNDQQDAQEFLTIFLDSLHEEIRPKPKSKENGVVKSNSASGHEIWKTFREHNDSPIGRIFYGLFESQCKFDGCLHSSSAYDPFSNLTLPLACTNSESFTLTVVPHFGAIPEVNSLESDGVIDISFVRKEVARRYNSSSNRIFLVRLVGGIFKPIYSKSKRRDSICATKENLDDKFWAFILPEPHSELSVGKEFTIILQNRILVPSATALLEETALMPIFLGGPTVIQISANVTNKDLYNIVNETIRRFVNPSNDLEKHENCFRAADYLKDSEEGLEENTRRCSAFCLGGTADYIFRIKHSDQHWFRCSKCPWSNMCRGCPILCNSQKVDLIRSQDTCVYLAVDWNIAAYINEYQQTQETKRKIVDPIEEEDLKMKNPTQLEHLLQSYFDVEHANEDECITCERCKKRKSFTKSTMILVLPDVLLISLKRFQATKRGWKKLNTPVEFPLTSLDMHSYLSKSAKEEKTLYDLYGVVNHAGTLNEGHYYAHIKLESDGRWFRINDNDCSEIPAEDVVTPDAYVLFYRRRKS
ncbi:hypothetical protein Aperf_G00000077273 [Anoplocephala perfoliata]